MVVTPLADFTQKLDVKNFLANYWQQSPLLLRDAFPVDPDLITGDDLAGLAMEPDVESRIISGNNDADNWQLQNGPFNDSVFDELPEDNWTLLVQAVDHWVPEVRSILSHFKFLPSWRIDDIMISYATPGGGVGPHFDQYDVFLIQLEGTREWKSGQLCNEDSEVLDQLPVKILTAFEEQERWVMKPGDVLYLPPSLAHWGTALENSITISVGFRAPSDSETISDFGHFLSTRVSEFSRYSDLNISDRSKASSEIQAEDINRLKTSLLQYINDDALLSNWLGQYMTEPKYNDIAVETGDFNQVDFVHHWQSNPIYRNAASRLAYYKKDMFVDGQCIETKLKPAVLEKICSGNSFVFDSDAEWSDGDVQDIMFKLLSQGAVFFEN